MIPRQKHNEEMRKARRKRAQYVRDKYMEQNIRSDLDFKPMHRDLGDKERREIRERLQNDFRKSRRRSVIVFLIAALFLVSLIYLLLHWW
jgi:hypothetical protein